MSIVKANRELLTDVLADLMGYHAIFKGAGKCCQIGPCSTDQRIIRLKGLLVRDEVAQNAV